MSPLGRLPSDSDLPFGTSPLSPSALVRQEPRGAAADHNATVAKNALDVPALPGAGTIEAHAELRRKKIAAIQANRGRVLNELGQGTIETCLTVTGLGLVAAVAGPEIAFLGGVIALGAALFGGRK